MNNEQWYCIVCNSYELPQYKSRHEKTDKHIRNSKSSLGKIKLKQSDKIKNPEIKNITENKFPWEKLVEIFNLLKLLPYY